MSSTRPVRVLAVIGAGNMGSGIAQKAATEGFPVILVDVDQAKVDRGLAIIDKTLADGIERKIFRPDAAKAIRDRITGTADWSQLAGADLVIEAVFEDFDVKREVFARLEKVCRQDAILATNTSSFLVTDLARGMAHPERMIGLHYFYHPAKNRLVEVIPGEQTAPEVTAAAWTVQEMMGKTPIHSADASGFIVNRYFVPWLNEAVRMLEDKTADIPTIEAAAKATFGAGMGPFELMNVTGIPIAMHAANTLGAAFGPFYAPATLLKKQVESGKAWDLSGTPDPSKFDAVSARLLGVVFLVATALVDDGIGTVEDTDIGARVGLRWPRGPIEMINRFGIKAAGDLVGQFGGGWDIPVPGNLSLQWRANTPFAFEFVKSEVTDGVATLTVNRPDAMNALNEAVVAQLHAAFKRAASDPKVKGIVIAGAGKAFIAGADIRFFVRNIESGDMKRIVDFTKAGHALLHDIDTCAKPVVARLHGLALGGGVELAQACDALIATPRASFAFPETGIGIYPGLGGTQRPTRRIGVGLTRWLVFTGQTLGAEEAAAIGFIDKVVPHEELDAACRAAIAEGIKPKARPPLSAKHAALESFFSSNDAETLRLGKADTKGDENLGKAMKRVGFKAPIALRLAGKLIESGASGSLEDGLAMELSHLEEIFTTKDAHEGLSTLGKKAPVFEGR
jgi:enoyl-CoA hydratase / 3-hydroxyacyl-CoA dehydrogenase